MNKSDYFRSGVVAILIAVVALGVAIFRGGKTTERIINSLGGTSIVDIIEVDEVAFKNASSTNLTTQSASTTPFMALQRLYIPQGSRIEQWANPFSDPITVMLVDVGYNNGTASSSERWNVFATTSPIGVIVPRYDYTALTEAIVGADRFLTRNYIIASSTVATTTNSFALSDINRGSPLIQVPGSGFLYFLRQQGDLLTSCSGGNESGQCESATSTNQGVGDYFARFLYFR